MSLADKIAVAAHTESLTVNYSSMEVGRGVDETGGFQIMSHVVWEEIGKSLMDEIGSVVFAAGSPKEFRQVSLYRLMILKSFETSTALRNDPSFYSFFGVACTFAACG
jgi:hypothetical protein